MKNLGKLIAVAAMALTLPPTPAQANPGIATHMKAYVAIVIEDATCTWSDAPLSADPPNYLAVYLSLAPYRTCETEDIVIGGDPNVFFNDPTSSASVDRIHSTKSRFGISCGYGATNVVLTGNVSTRDYSGTFTATRVSGSTFVCPSTAPGSMLVDFH
jgi:hypothetical protein